MADAHNTDSDSSFTAAELRLIKGVLNSIDNDRLDWNIIVSESGMANVTYAKKRLRALRVKHRLLKGTSGDGAQQPSPSKVTKNTPIKAEKLKLSVKAEDSIKSELFM